jgi:hypothetical protein
MGRLMPYFVSIRRDSRVGILAGPFGTLDIAESYIEPASRVAVALNSWHHFDAFGVAYIPGRMIAGKLNDQLGIPSGLTYRFHGSVA